MRFFHMFLLLYMELLVLRIFDAADRLGKIRNRNDIHIL